MPPTASKPWWRRWFGTRSERAAARFLKRLGYRILVRNYTCPLGELDLIALDGRTLVFVEVRSTEADNTSGPAASVDVAKQRRLTRLALFFLKQKRLLGHTARFDVLTLSWPEAVRKPAFEHFKNAFEAVGDVGF
ncbi:MAG: YraN family protein [Planctomycetes bacterium]|nr:YraN family protein [Planctomycetota bacterium]